MTPEEAKQVLSAARIVKAHIEGDSAAKAAFMEEFVTDVSLMADAMTKLAIAAGTLISVSTARNLSRTFEEAKAVPDVLIPGVGYERPAAIALAVAVQPGNAAAITEATKGLDIPTAINSSFNLALGTILSLSAAWDKSPSFVADLMIKGAEREI